MKPKVKFKELVIFLGKFKNPLGDLCRDILSDKEFPINNQQKALKELRSIGFYYNLENLTNKLINTYKTINKQ